MASDGFDLYEFINADIVEEDVSEKLQHGQASYASHTNGNSALADEETNSSGVDLTSSTHEATTQEPLPLSLLSAPCTPFDNATNTSEILQADTALSQAMARYDAIRGFFMRGRVGEEALDTSLETHESEASGSSGLQVVPVHGSSTAHWTSTRARPLSASSGSQSFGRLPISTREATEVQDENKENASSRPANPRRVGFPQSHPNRLQSVPQQSCPSRENEQPVTGPSSVTIEDLALREQSEERETESKGTKRTRSTGAQVAAAQLAPRQVDRCGLDGGCAHALTNVPRDNKAHIGSAHDCRIPPDAGTPGSAVGPLRRRKQILSGEEARQCAVAGDRMCTWGVPGGPRCGQVFGGATAQANLERHVESVHWKRQFGCDQCASVFNSLRSLVRHKKGVHAAEREEPDAPEEHEDEDAEDEQEPPSKRRRMQ